MYFVLDNNSINFDNYMTVHLDNSLPPKISNYIESNCAASKSMS